MNDGTYFEPLQVVYHDTMENFAAISKLNVGSAIIVKGELVATPEAKQPFEIQAEEIAVEGNSTTDYPLQKKRHTLEYLRTQTHLRARTNTFQAVFRVRSLIAYAIHQYFQERDFVYVHTPIITGSDCEGAGEMFRVTTLDLDNLPEEMLDGIYILDKEYPLGADIKEILGLNDSVIEFEITNNRPDCLSIIGIARETAATFESQLRYPRTDFKENSEKIGDYIEIQVENSELCPRYSAKMIKNIVKTEKL
jgi:hypothetical protein